MPTQNEILAIVENPEAHGFRWNSETLHKAGIPLHDCPTMEHVDSDKLLATFGPRYFLDMANGTSGRVRDQEVARSMIYEKRNVDRKDVKVAVIERAFGIKARRTATVVVEKKIYLAIDGSEHATAQDALARNVDLQLEDREAMETDMLKDRLLEQHLNNQK